MSAGRIHRGRPRLAAALGVAAIVAMAGAGGAAAQETVPAPAEAAERLDAAAGWRDLLEAHRSPLRPRPGDTESLILVLDAPPAGSVPAARRAQALADIEEQQGAVERVLADLGAVVTHRTAVVANTMSVALPAGGTEALARVAGVQAVVPVGFLAPAQADPGPPPGAEPGSAATPAPVGRPSGRAVRVAVLDAGIDPSHPALGGGMGPTFPILGGLDLVDGDADPRIPSDAVLTEAHGTQVVGVLLGSPAISDLAPAERPRVIVHRVVATEPVGGRLRPLARTDRVLMALERSVDPDGDGDPGDAADIVLIALSAGFTGAGRDPLNDAIDVADGLGVSVVAAAGNDGPTLTLPGSVGGPAAAPAALTVGALASRPSGGLVDLTVSLGAAAARLDDLPLVGGPVADGDLPAVLLDGPAGLLTGADDAEFRDEAGESRVSGAAVVVARGGENLHVLAHRAAAAGARALLVWDRDAGTFAISGGDGDLPIPVVGVGPGQGEGLAGLVRSRADLRLSLSGAGETRAAGPAVAAFSSTGPTAAGLQKPEILAPGIAVEAPLPGRGADGLARTGTLTGTSASAARAAALVARLRTERPGLGPAAVRSLIVQGAAPLPGVPVVAQGAGALGPPAGARVAVEPAVVHARPVGDGAARRIDMTVRNLTDRPLDFRVALRAADGAERTLRLGGRLPAGGARAVGAVVPRGARGTLVVRETRGGTVLGQAPLVPVRIAASVSAALGRPEVRRAGDRAEVIVRVGRLARVEDRVVGRVLSDLRVVLMPADGEAPVPVLGTRQPGAWPAGTYRVLVSARGSDGADVAPGRYRVRVRATAADGTVLRRTSGVVAIG